MKKSWIKDIKNSDVIKGIRIMMFAKSAEAAGYGKTYELDLKKVIAPTIKFATIVMAVGFGFFIVWGGLAPLDQANMAEAIIAVAGNNKSIQHQEGGIIEEIKVTDGQKVAEGEPLIVLDDKHTGAEVKIYKSHLMFALATQERLLAEQDKLESVNWDLSVYNLEDPAIKQIVKTQNNIFNTSKKAYDGKIEVYKEQISNYLHQITGLKSQLASYQSQMKLINEEMASAEALHTQGFGTKTRLYEFKKNYNEMLSRIAQTQSQILSMQQEISAREIEILNVENDHQKAIASELKQNHAQLLEFEEKYKDATQVLHRKIIRAPVSGIVTDLQYHTIGGVIGPGQRIMDIVPENHKLIVEAKVKTQDIDGISLGMTAKVQLSAFKSKLVPRLSGKVIYVAADKTFDPQRGHQYPYYLARIEIDEEELASLNADVKLYPGMPAAVFIIKGTRTFLRYLMDPITDSFYKAFKEK